MTTTTKDPGAILALIDPEYAYVTREHQRRLADRVKIARTLAGRISQGALAVALTEVTGEEWSRDLIANFETLTARKRATVSDVEALARTFRERFGLETIDVDWLVGESGSFLGNIPGYLGSDDIVDVTDSAA